MLLLALVSAVWVETDTYRIASVIMVLWGIAIYVRAEFRPTIGWIGLLCVGWTLYVAGRMALVYLSHSSRTLGTSEGIYLLPIFYMTVGYTTFLYRAVLGRTVIAFLLISAAMAVATVDVGSIFDDKVHDFLWMNNTIHSSVGGGLIILAAINILTYRVRTAPREAPAWQRIGIPILCIAVIVLCFLGIYGAKSKGVWVSFAGALLLQFLLSFGTAGRRRAIGVAVLLLAALALFGWVFGDDIWATIGPTVDGSAVIVARALGSHDPLAVIRESIATNAVPESATLRLMLWYDALQVWAEHPMLGSGVGWEDAFFSARYQNVGFNIVHNGYLEIGMRYGFLGIAFYAVLYGWALLMSRRAYLAQLIPREAAVLHGVSMAFFLGTIMSNSNNRLAIGESYMMAAAAFGFYSFYLLQLRDTALKTGNGTADMAGTSMSALAFSACGSID